MSSRRNKGGTYSIPTRFPVLVTGANGYLAGVLIRDLLQAGLTVHGTVRDLEEAKAEKRKRDAANKIPLKPKDPNAEKKEEPPVKPKEEEYPELYALEGAAERLHLFEANLLKAGSFADAIEGCRVVFHVASPHILPETPNSKEAYKEGKPHS
jgi:nucleoside-diphosphate-sugar epimerase